MTERQLTLALDALVDPCLGVVGDWSEVLARAGATPAPESGQGLLALPRRRLRRRRRRLALALTACLLSALVLLATGFGRDALVSLLGRVDIEFGASRPAPAIVRRDFAVLSFGLPPRNAPNAIVDDTRAVTSFDIDGRERTLWVAPTRRGGFCWVFERASGGCFDHRRDIPQGPDVTWVASPRARVPTRIEGVVLSSKAQRLIAEFRDGTTKDIPFVYVSKPIDAGFFLWSVPSKFRHRHTSLRQVSALDGHGAVIASTTLPSLTPRPKQNPSPAPQSAKPLPQPGPLGRGLPAPTSPLQHGRGDGASVTVGRNGVVLFDLTGLDEERREVLHGRTGAGCFAIEYDQLGVWPRELLVGRTYGSKIKLRLFGIRHPYDGCEIQAGYGHRWPDRLGSHSAVEIALTSTGRRYFVDRAAARDLSQFMRENKGTELRRETGRQLERGLSRIGQGRLVALGTRSDVLPVDKIGYVLDGTAVTYVKRSPTGKRFFVHLDDGQVTSQNLRPYAISY